MSEPKDSGSAIEIGEKENGNGKGKRFDPGFKLFGKTIPVCHCSEIDEDTAREKEESQRNAEGDEGKATSKKPDKLLPCPRCESMDTKFCYYNNYNVNQPRHFCKNCQRYWTAGGTLRNVPVGAGRRKNKHSYRHPDGGLAIRTDDPVVVPCLGPLKIGNSRIQVLPLEPAVLKFGDDDHGGPWSYGWGFGYGSPGWAGAFMGPWSPPNSSVEPGSPSLGKHSRERSQPDCGTEGCLWIPKSLRIDDAGEAAKSSVWTTLAAGNNLSQSAVAGGGIFRAFRTAEAAVKDSVKAPAPPRDVHLNPAAFARSVAFRESG